VIKREEASAAFSEVGDIEQAVGTVAGFQSNVRYLTEERRRPFEELRFRTGDSWRDLSA
jgi:hypothetical protein